MKREDFEDLSSPSPSPQAPAPFMLLILLLSFIAGALPFSVWVGELALKPDIHAYGNHNPGATNVLRAGGWVLAAVAFLLDFLKGRRQ